MKLLIMSPSYPPHTGGLESHSQEFNQHFAKKRHSVTVFTPFLSTDSISKKTKSTKKVKIIYYPALEIIPNYPLPKFWSMKFWQLFFSLYKQDFDIVISRTRFFLTSFMALIFAKTKKIKHVHIEHGSDFVQLSSNYKNFIAKFYDHTLGKLVLKFSNLNISISEAVQKFVYKFDKRKSPIIYRGLNMQEIDSIEEDNKTKNTYKNKIIITFVGRLYKWKGVENSIQAIQSLPTGIKKNIIFLIIGDGEDYSDLQKIAQKEKIIFMLGNLPRNKAISILKTSAIYIHSAYPGGGLSTSLLEAMYCKNAIIATPNEGAKEVIKNNHNGILIDNNNPKLIKEKIIDLINDSVKMKEFRNNARKYIKDNFSWKRSIKKYEKEFNKILAEK